MNKQLAVIDIEFGKKLAGGREDIALEMINMLRDTLPQDFSAIKTNFEKRALADMQIDVHQLLGAVSYCGTPALKQAVIDLELTLKNNSTEKISLFFTQLESEVKRFLAYEHLVLVNQQDEPLGYAEKMTVHEQALCHRAFSVFILRKTEAHDEVLIHQRNPLKYHSGGLWTNTCCGHPRPREDIKAAAERRLQEEMGIKTSLHYLDKFHYIAKLDKGLTEHEVDYVFYAYINDFNFTVNPNEVSDIKWLTIPALQDSLSQNPQTFTPWLDQALTILVKMKKS